MGFLLSSDEILKYTEVLQQLSVTPTDVIVAQILWEYATAFPGI